MDSPYRPTPFPASTTTRIPCWKGAETPTGPNTARADEPMKIGVLPAGAGPVTTGTSRPVIFLRTAARSWTESRRRMRCFSASSAGLTSPVVELPEAMTAGSTTMAHRASPDSGINVRGTAATFAAETARPQAASTTTKNLLMSFLMLNSSLPIDANADDSTAHTTTALPIQHY